MNSDHSDAQKPSSKSREHEEVGLNPGNPPKPANVPVFSCIVYVSPDAGGGVRARVANLSGLESTAASEREALAKIVRAFKERVGELLHSNSPIPWIEPPSPEVAGEQKRFIPVHL